MFLFRFPDSTFSKFKSISLYISLIFIFGFVFFFSGPTARAEIVAELSPHRAIYDLNLDKASERSGISSISARLVYEIKGSSCEGYTLNIRLLSTLMSRGGKKNITDIRISSFEAAESESYHYTSQEYLNQTQTQKHKGLVMKAGGKVEVTQDEPVKKRGNLPVDTFFPNEHVLKVLRAAKEGERLLQTHYFDGSDGPKPFRVSTIIGKGKVPGSVKFKNKIPANGRLETLGSWPVIMSFFEMNKTASGEQTPIYEMSLHLFENGVSSQMKLSYADFSMSGDMVDLEFYPPGKCH